MIRINLLPRERGRAKRRGSVPVAGQKITVASTLILVLAGLAVAWWYRSIQKDAARVAEEIMAAEQETARLKTIIVQVQQFEQRKGQLQQRVTLIEQLRRGQSGPVHLLDEVSRSLPDMVWLSVLDQKGADVTLDGRCTALTSLSDFVNNLEASGWFRRPVEITDSQVERPAGTDIDLIRFTVKAQFAQPGG
ncbi:MAG: PilN domain-containing protein [Vicinamibacterales bacterium]|nr:PilN domain-containing protein [Vicinamibacterales bacterium]